MSDLNELIEPLYKATIEKKIEWIADGETMISTRQGANLLEVVWTGQSLRFRIRNKDGVLMEEKAYNPNLSQGATLMNTFKQVKRDALGVDQAIQDVKRKLLALGG